MAVPAGAATSAQARAPRLAGAAATDPRAFGSMLRSPPDRIVRFADGSLYGFPQLRRSFSNVRQLAPTANVSRGASGAAPLVSAPRDDHEAIGFTTMGGRIMTGAQSLSAVFTEDRRGDGEEAFGAMTRAGANGR